MFLRWNVTVRCSDVEGAHVDGTFQFEILNENDPPTSAKVVSVLNKHIYSTAVRLLDIDL
jgi:hypothetical protein